jgi:hypothetical protein
MRKGERGGGPASQEGKKISSMNSLVHGATSPLPVGPGQRRRAEQYVKELVDFYKPESPLEKLQIERIAVCKVKLDGLYELEELKLQIAAEDLSRDPGQIMERVHSGDELVNSFVQQLANGEPLKLLYGLTPDSLSQIVAELSAFGRLLNDDDKVFQTLPAFGRLLDSVIKECNVVGSAAAVRLKNDLDDLLLRDRPDKEWANTMILVEWAFSVERAVKNDEPIPEHPFTKLKSDGSNEEALNSINDSLKSLFKLNEHVKNATVLSREFARVRELMIRALTLSSEESDRLMRYQTTWERRLSSAVGELLALLSKREA